MTHIATPVLRHATCVAIDGHGVLLCGASGSGKSDLALRLIDRGAVLVADDICEIRLDGGAVLVSPPATTAGSFEVRGIGIIAMPYLELAPVRLIVDLVDCYPRMPDHADTYAQIAAIDIARIAINPFENSAPHKVQLALARAIRN